MEKIKISESDKRLLIILLAVVLLAASYFLVFNSGMKKAQEIEAANLTDNQRVMQLESMVARQESIVQETEELKQKEKAIIEKYPADVTEEKVISIVQDIENRMDFKVDQITYMMDNLVGSTDAVTGTEGTSTEDTNGDSTETSSETGTADTATDSSVVTGGYASITLNYTASYTGLKKMVDYVNQSSDRMTMTAITSTFDEETGKLTGVLTLNMYYIKGTEKEYEAPVIDGIDKGVSDIFGSVSGK